ncbi:efflux RND transporter periplasmic adaptor subunit [Chitinophaga pendula]|uniref:efflux RND transporter periplasmic adaptor subunit n=1 Tax=Chitinophaga TaxID=79328 RepID=UPI000BAF12D2|nr:MULTISPECIES: efflux RND transporter periplasmic adaptor subunit [Chitinophaga]ASZ13340.1 efflux transporter periplasmic adaptor subunit [Chitinophaga sp. MD30]UCJ09034.1 efflux RND transporter periplasmic adaptor subunit [Chitinophaga pendula]
MQFNNRQYVPILFTLFTAATLGACNSQPQEVPVRRWALTDSLVRTLQIDTATNRPVDQELYLTGKISVNEDKVARIFPMVSGIVTAVKVHSGDFVQQGQTLAVMRSAEMAGYSADHYTAESELQLARRNMEVAASFFKSGLNAQKDVEEAKSNYAKAKAAYEKSKEILAINGGSQQNSYLVKAPEAGFIISKKAVEHMQWRPDNADPIFTVADLKEVWAMLNVFESDISGIREGDEVTMTTLAYPDKVFTGRIDKIYNVLDPDNKVMKARVVVKNTDYLLKPEMFVRIRAARHSDNEMVSIPSRGIIFDHDKYYVLVRTFRAPFVEVREVQIARTLDDRSYIATGLQPGEQVIASRQVFIYETLQAQ